MDRFQYIRRVELVSKHGRSELHSTVHKALGSIQPASGRTLRIMPHLVNIAGTIEIWTKAALQTTTERTQADLIIWQGSHYIIAEKLDDWQNFRGGYTHAVCTLYNLETEANFRAPDTP